MSDFIRLFKTRVAAARLAQQARAVLIRDLAFAPAASEVFAALGLPPGASAFHLICVQRENDVPVQTLLRRTWANGTAGTPKPST